MSKENITLDELAQMVSRGFEKTVTKDELNEGLAIIHEEMNERFDRVELHISSLGSDWRERFVALEMRVQKLERSSRAGE